MKYNAEQQEAFEEDFKKTKGKELEEIEEYIRAGQIIKMYAERGINAFICAVDEKTGNVIVAHSLCLVANQEENPHDYLLTTFKKMSPCISEFLKNFKKFFLK